MRRIAAAGGAPMLVALLLVLSFPVGVSAPGHAAPMGVAGLPALAAIVPPGPPVATAPAPASAAGVGPVAGPPTIGAASACALGITSWVMPHRTACPTPGLFPHRAAQALQWQQLGSYANAWYGATTAYDPELGFAVRYGGISWGATWFYAGGIWSNDTGNLSSAPPPLLFPSLVYDPAFQQLVLFGGEFPDGRYSNETWIFGTGSWTNFTGNTGRTPPGGLAPAMAYDGVDGELVLALPAGPSPSAGAVTWTFANDLWTNVTATAGSSPDLAAGPGFAGNGSGPAYLFGGANATGGVSNVTWEFSHQQWQPLVLPGPVPPGRAYAELAANPSDGALLLFGGYGLPNVTGGIPVPLLDTWSFNGSAWTNLTATVGPAPGPRLYAELFSDAAAGGVIVAGGYDPFLEYLDDDQWLLTGSAWTLEASAPGPTAAAAPALTYDTADGYDLLFGGSDLNATWAYTGGAWVAEHPAVSPSGRFGTATAYDATDGYVVLFGGTTGFEAGGQFLQDTWTYAHGAWTDRTVSAGPGPAARAYAGIAFDPAVHGLVLFGGQSSTVGYSDTWIFSGGTWTNVTATSGTPPKNVQEFGMTYDSADGLVLLQGGQGSCAGAALALCNATWGWNGSWRPIPTSRAPTGDEMDLVDDPALGAVVLFGGWAALHCTTTSSGGGCSYGASDMTWTYTAGVWTNRTADLGLPPPANYLAGATYDPALQGVILFGGAMPAPTTAWYLLSEATVAPLSVGLISASVEPVVEGRATQVTVAVTGGLAPYRVAWTGLPPGCGTPTSTSFWCSPTEPGVYSVNATVTDRLGSSAAPPFGYFLIVDPSNVSGLALVVAVPTHATVAPGDSVNLTAVAVNGRGERVPANYTWTLTGVAALLNVSQGRNVSLTAGGLDGNVGVFVNATYQGASSGAALQLTIAGVPVAVGSFTAAPARFEVGGSTVLKVLPSGGTGQYRYSYSGLPAGCTNANVSSLTCAPVSSGNYSVTVRLTDGAGGHAVASVTFSTYPVPPGGVVSLPPLGATPLWEYVAVGALGVAAVAAIALGLRRPRQDPPPRDPSADVPPPELE